MCSNTDLIFPALIQQTTKGTKLHKGKPSRLPVLRVPSCPWWFRNSLEANSMASFVSFVVLILLCALCGLLFLLPFIKRRCHDFCFHALPANLHADHPSDV